jgi:hypothetical protein
MDSAADYLYPIDWRRSPVVVREPVEARRVLVESRATTSLARMPELIASAACREVERELAGHGVLSIRASPPSRRQCREQLRSHARYAVVLDLVAPRSMLATGTMHEAAALCYAEIAALYPLSVTSMLVGVTDETRSFRAAAALTANGDTDVVDNHHAFIVSPNGRSEAAMLRHRIERAEREKTSFSGVRLARPDRSRAKFAPPPPPDWLVRLRQRQEVAPLPTFEELWRRRRSTSTKETQRASSRDGADLVADTVATQLRFHDASAIRDRAQSVPRPRAADDPETAPLLAPVLPQALPPQPPADADKAVEPPVAIPLAREERASVGDPVVAALREVLRRVAERQNLTSVASHRLR